MAGFPVVKYAVLDLAKNGTRAAIAAVPGKGYYILGLFLSGGAAAGSMILLDGSTALTGTMTFAENGQLNLAPLPVDTHVPYFKVSAGNAFNITLSANMDADGWVIYREV